MSAVSIVRLSHADEMLESVRAIDRAVFSAGEQSDFTAELERPFSNVWVARVDDIVVGFAVVWTIADELHLLSMATAPSAGRRGIGTALVNHLLSQAAGESVSRILLEVRDSKTAARLLYERAGFRCTRRRVTYYTEPVEDGLDTELDMLRPAKP